MSAQPIDEDDEDTRPVPLVETATDLRERFGLIVPYQTLWGAVVGGTVPATRVRGRWYTQRSDHARIAGILGGNRQPARAKPSERSPAAA